jgi:hypothetical protein
MLYLETGVHLEKEEVSTLVVDQAFDCSGTGVILGLSEADGRLCESISEALVPLHERTWYGAS